MGRASSSERRRRGVHAAVPHIVGLCAGRWRDNWNGYALAVTIESARGAERNPTAPAWLRGEYDTAWRRLTEISVSAIPQADDPELLSSLLAVLSISEGLPNLARMAMLSEEERQNLLDEAGWA